MSPRILGDMDRIKGLTALSMAQIEREYSAIFRLDQEYLLERQDGSHFSFGAMEQGKFIVYTRIATTVGPKLIKRAPHGLGPVIRQVTQVNTDRRYLDEGFAKRAYTLTATYCDLISDRNQYESAKDLWQSVARDAEGINVYAYDSRRFDYLRTPKGKIIQYNGKNIDEELIWGDELDYSYVLLIATKKQLKN